MSRPYQLEAIERVRARMWGGARRVCLVMPTGSGKTRTCGEIAQQTVSMGRRVLWLAHRSELVDQAADALTELGLTVGAQCSSAAAPPNPFAPVQVASVQTLLARRERPPADLIVADEAHHFAAAAEQWAALLACYPEALIVGPTATPERGDGCGLEGSFDAIVVGATVSELTEGGHLVPCQVLRPDTPLAPGQIARDPVDAYLEHAPGRRAAVFVRTVPLAEQYAADFRLRGIEARCVSAETPWAERRLYIDAFRRGAIQVLVNVYVLTEGFDAPELSCVIVARGCGSAGMWLQMIGRALRTCGRCAACLARNRGDGGVRCTDKPDAIVLDLRGASHEHGRPDDERDYELSGRGIRLRDPNCYCPVCGQPRVPSEGCPSCGWVPTVEDLAKPDTVVGVSLKPYFRLRETDDDTKRAMRLSHWIADSRSRGYKDGYWRGKFAAVYGGWPSGKLIAAAFKLLAPASAAPSPPTSTPSVASTDVRSWMASRPHTPECRCKDCRARREVPA